MWTGRIGRRPRAVLRQAELEREMDEEEHRVREIGNRGSRTAPGSSFDRNRGAV
jgi:hypothetical protein